MTSKVKMIINRAKFSELPTTACSKRVMKHRLFKGSLLTEQSPDLNVGLLLKQLHLSK